MKKAIFSIVILLTGLFVVRTDTFRMVIRFSNIPTEQYRARVFSRTANLKDSGKAIM